MVTTLSPSETWTPPKSSTIPKIEKTAEPEEERIIYKRFIKELHISHKPLNN